ncbi:two-component system response regulator RppA [Geitlerinema sp. PCC 9228]|jgi:OmpR-family two-component system manganese-sensing response regulator|uniref:two-component system response regulator RppA n=1 Tax=Geitlerinema sp. PCC 9228 TaxID=111611 RepID=UPI0008F9AAE1|nr:two-component system response regulator RppA [Geitlerinema sp. PCC 9228]
MRILLVDDEVELTDPLYRVLTKEGYDVDVAYDGTTGVEMAAQGSYDLFILDWLMPGKSGLQLCQELRERGDTTPVLFLTAKDTLDDRVAGLDAGADDYIVKPFELRELLARVRASLRRSEPSQRDVKNDRLQVADLRLDRENQLAYRGDRKIELSEKETRLLELFLSHPGQLLTHTQIYQHLWSDSDRPSSNVLAALVRLLRRKIAKKGEPQLIQSVYGKGYRLQDSQES